MKPKVIISTYDSLINPHYHGGGAVAIHEVARRLTKKYSVTVVAGNYRGATNSQIDKVTYVYLGTRLHPFFDQAYFHFASLFYALSHPFDFWLESFTPPAVLGLIPRVTSQPVIGIAHMLPAEDMERKYHLPFTWIERLGLNKYHHIVATTGVFARKIKELAPNTSITIIPNGVTKFKLLRKSRSNLVYLGRIEINQKGIDRLVKAYLAEPRLHNYPLIIAGGGAVSEVARLKKLIGSHPQIKYIGEVSGESKRKLLSSALALVVPSRFETFSLTAAEAIVHKIPLVTYNLQGLSWIPKNLRYIATDNSPQALSKQLLSVVSNYPVAKRRAVRASKQIKLPSWDSVSRQYQRLLVKVAYDKR